MKWFLGLISMLFGLVNQNLLDPIAGYVAEVVPTATPILVKESNQMKVEVEPTIALKRGNPSPAVRRVGDTEPWGVARQIGEHTWTMKVGMDKKMATPREIFEALNEYRIRRGSQRLAWDENLSKYAQSRAEYLYSIKSTDEHKGFADYLEKEDGFEKLGFTSLGENISYGYQLEGVHIIEWMYAGDKPHDDNQVNNRWNYVGIGVKGTATAVIFGTGKR